MYKLKFVIFLFLVVFMTLITTYEPLLAWTVAPVRFEIKGEKDKEYTFTFSVLNESQLHQKRFETYVDDWVIDKNNNFLRKAFNPSINNKYSASTWIKVTPQQFVVSPGETKNIRFTVSVPDNVSLDGEYSTGIFVGEKNIEKPLKGEKVVHIKQDTFIGVVVYVKIGKEKHNVVLKDLKIDAKPLGNGLSKIIVIPSYESKGNIHSRAEVTIKAEPIPEGEKENVKEFTGGEAVLLRESELSYPIELSEPFKSGSEWKFSIRSDFGKDGSILVGTKKFKIPNIQNENKINKK